MFRPIEVPLNVVILFLPSDTTFLLVALCFSWFKDIQVEKCSGVACLVILLMSVCEFDLCKFVSCKRAAQQLNLQVVDKTASFIFNIIIPRVKYVNHKCHTFIRKP